MSFQPGVITNTRQDKHHCDNDRRQQPVGEAEWSVYVGSWRGDGDIGWISGIGTDLIRHQALEWSIVIQSHFSLWPVGTFVKE